MRGFIISAGVFFLLNNSFGFAQSDPNRRASALDAYEDNGRRAPDQNGDMNFHGFGGKRSCFVKEPAWIAPSSASRSGGPAPSEQQNPYTWVNGQIQTWISPGELPFGFADASLAGLSNARLFLSESGLERSDPDGRFALRIPTMGGILSTNLVSDHVKVYDRAFIPGDERTSCEIFQLLCFSGDFCPFFRKSLAKGWRQWSCVTSGTKCALIGLGETIPLKAHSPI